MSTNFATKNQADEIKQRMAEIRAELPYSAEIARARVQELTDWKYHLKQHPLPILAAVAAVGYLLVPHKQPAQRIVVQRDGSEMSQATTPSKRGILGGIVGSVATLALRHLTTVAANQILDSVNKRGST